ncbi:unnamed protein product [Caenorhabditis angaria]|uniref:Ground-like domain-containing protein n=1 Tax=Caenorhabditis angaria TaxID=860376 RepID=A0A9P1IZ72_9PELO|nr:unnamed protein product [Caenorhabditis angaria]
MKLLLILAVLITIAAACPGLFGMGGCCHQQSHCGGCGDPLPERPAKPDFFGITSNDKDSLCNSPELKKLIVDNMHPNAVDSAKALQGVLEEHKLQRFVVICSAESFVYTVRADTAYCGAWKNGHTCHAFAL